MPSGLEVQTGTTTQDNQNISPLAGKPAPEHLLVDISRLEKAYFEREPDVTDPGQEVR